MRIRTLSIVICLMAIASCDFRKSIHKDLITGLVTRGDGLSCEDVKLNIDDEIIQRNSFVYGEDFVLSFINIEGFDKVDNHAFPGMNLNVISQSGDTVLKNRDLYADMVDGTDLSPLRLNTKITVGDPIHSNEEYTLHVSIWDKKSDGVFTAKFNFDVVPNDQIYVESENITYREVYLYSKQRQKVIVDNMASFDENIYIMVEGLEGFVVENDKVSVGLSMKINDEEGNVIVDEENLLGSSEYDYSEVYARLSANFIITGSTIDNPIDCQIVIWDMKSSETFKAFTQLHIE